MTDFLQHFQLFRQQPYSYYRLFTALSTLQTAKLQLLQIFTAPSALQTANLQLLQIFNSTFVQLFIQQTYSYYRCLQHFYVTTGVAQAISNVSGLHLATTS